MADNLDPTNPPPPQKDTKWLVTAFAFAALLILAAYFNYVVSPAVPNPLPTPTPVATASPTPSPTASPTPVATATPTPTPTPVATATPTPTPTVTAPATVFQASTEGPERPYPGHDLAMASSLTVKLAKNETVGRVIKGNVSACTPLAATGLPAGVAVSFFRMESLTTTKPSFQGAVLGKHYDPLVPTAQACPGDLIWVDFSASKTAAAGSYSAKVNDLPVTVKVWNFSMPDRPTMPLYAGLQPYGTLLGHKMSPNSGVAEQGPVVLKYVSLLRAHRIEPMGAALANPPAKADGTIDLDQWGGVGSFRQMVINGAIAPVWVMSGPFASVSWSPNYAAWEKTIAAEPGLKDAFAYLTDEPCDTAGCGNNADPGLANTAARIKAQEAAAPTLRSMVVHDSDARLAGLDIAVPSFEQVKAAPVCPTCWVYGACNSHGSCANGFTGKASGTPDLMIDQPSAHYRAFPLVAYALGGKAALYYSVNNMYGRKDPWVDQYDFGGNGDGELVYPGIPGEHGFTAQEAVGGYRLKLIRQGMYDAEYVRLAPTQALRDRFKALVPNQYGWSRNEADFEALREAIGEALGN